MGCKWTITLCHDLCTYICNERDAYVWFLALFDLRYLCVISPSFYEVTSMYGPKLVYRYGWMACLCHDDKLQLCPCQFHHFADFGPQLEDWLQLLLRSLPMTAKFSKRVPWLFNCGYLQQDCKKQGSPTHGVMVVLNLASLKKGKYIVCKCVDLEVCRCRFISHVRPWWTCTWWVPYLAALPRCWFMACKQASRIWNRGESRAPALGDRHKYHNMIVNFFAFDYISAFRASGQQLPGGSCWLLYYYCTWNLRPSHYELETSQLSIIGLPNLIRNGGTVGRKAINLSLERTPQGSICLPYISYHAL